MVPRQFDTGEVEVHASVCWMRRLADRLHGGVQHDAMYAPAHLWAWFCSAIPKPESLQKLFRQSDDGEESCVTVLFLASWFEMYCTVSRRTSEQQTFRCSEVGSRTSNLLHAGAPECCADHHYIVESAVAKLCYLGTLLRFRV